MRRPIGGPTRGSGGKATAGAKVSRFRARRPHGGSAANLGATRRVVRSAMHSRTTRPAITEHQPTPREPPAVALDLRARDAMARTLASVQRTSGNRAATVLARSVRPAPAAAPQVDT